MEKNHFQKHSPHTALVVLAGLIAASALFINLAPKLAPEPKPVEEQVFKPLPDTPLRLKTTDALAEPKKKLAKVEPAPKPKKVSQKDLTCMAENIYYEAGGESYTGKLAVGHVVLNRKRDHRYPNSICKVIHQSTVVEKKVVLEEFDAANIADEAIAAEKAAEEIAVAIKEVKVCQFSWVCDDRKEINKASKAWRDSKAIAQKLLSLPSNDVVHGATNFHATSVSPRWKNTLVRVTAIDNHIFYKHRR